MTAKTYQSNQKEKWPDIQFPPLSTFWEDALNKLLFIPLQINNFEAII